jgi:hypothetical protein
MGDESLFFYYTLNSRILLPPDAETPEVTRQLINTPKVMVRVFWNSSGLYVKKFLEGSISVNSTYFTEYLLSDIERLPVLQTALQQKEKFVRQMDNSLVHKSCMVTEKVASLRLALEPHARIHLIWHRLTSFSLDT